MLALVTAVKLLAEIALLALPGLWVVGLLSGSDRKGNPVYRLLQLLGSPWLRATFGITSPVELWWGIDPISAGLFGVPVGFAVIVLVSLVTPPPSQKAQDMVEYLRYPDLKRL